MGFIGRLIFAVMVIVPSMSFGNGFSVDTNRFEQVSVTTTSTKIVNADKDRNYLLIQNKGLCDLIVKVGSVQTASEGIVIISGGSWEPSRPPREAVWAKGSTCTDTTLINEGR